MITGKDGKSIIKREVQQSSRSAQGFKKVVFAHKASAGETSIDLTSLSTPAEMSAMGFINPSPTELADAKLFRYKENLTLTSSSKNTLIQNLSYRVSSGTRISLGFEADEGEIFVGILDANQVDGIQVIDAKTPVVDGDLAVGLTDFAIGFSTRTLTEEILVIRNGLIQKRNTNNSSTVMDGNYYIVDNGNGYGSVVRFNDAASGDADYIKVTAIGGVIESPTNSTWDELEKVQGQIDAMIPDLALATGNPEANYQAAPNNVDLRQFGAVVTGLLDINIPYQNDTIIDVTGSGAFTGGTIRVSRIGTQVTIQSETPLTFPAQATPTSADGIIPEWARPTITRWNLYINNGSNYVARANVTAAGGFAVDFSEWTGADDATNSTDDAYMSITYSVVDNESKTIKEHLEDKGLL